MMYQKDWQNYRLSNYFLSDFESFCFEGGIILKVSARNPWVHSWPRDWERAFPRYWGMPFQVSLSHWSPVRWLPLWSTRENKKSRTITCRLWMTGHQIAIPNIFPRNRTRKSLSKRRKGRRQWTKHRETMEWRLPWRRRSERLPCFRRYSLESRIVHRSRA